MNTKCLHKLTCHFSATGYQNTERNREQTKTYLTNPQTNPNKSMSGTQGTFGTVMRGFLSMQNGKQTQACTHVHLSSNYHWIWMTCCIRVSRAREQSFDAIWARIVKSKNRITGNKVSLNSLICWDPKLGSLFCRDLYLSQFLRWDLYRPRLN